MLPPDLEARVAAIAADTVSGANELGLRALEAFEAYCTAPRTPDGLRELAAKLEAAQPSMAAVRNVAHMCAQLVQEGDAALALREVRREITEAPGKIARNALKVITGKPKVVTLSRSAAVLATLKLLHARGFLSAVTVLESRPGFEGRRSAEELALAGIATRIVVDALGPAIVRDCDAVLVGADSVLRDGALVNKAGTYGLALAAKTAGKPFYAACETMKIDASRTAATFPPPQLRPEDELEPPPSVTAFNAYFDLTPSDLVTSFITDRGVYEPRRIAQFVQL